MFLKIPPPSILFFSVYYVAVSLILLNSHYLSVVISANSSLFLLATANSMEELNGISYPETCIVSSFSACESRVQFSLGELQHHIAWVLHHQATPATLGKETSTWAERASD